MPGGIVIYLADPDVTLHQGDVTACLAELNPDYCELAARRLAQQSIFSLGGEL